MNRELARKRKEDARKRREDEFRDYERKRDEKYEKGNAEATALMKEIRLIDKHHEIRRRLPDYLKQLPASILEQQFLYKDDADLAIQVEKAAVDRFRNLLPPEVNDVSDPLIKKVLKHDYNKAYLEYDNKEDIIPVIVKFLSNEKQKLRSKDPPYIRLLPDAILTAFINKPESEKSLDQLLKIIDPRRDAYGLHEALLKIVYEDPGRPPFMSFENLRKALEKPD